MQNTKKPILLMILDGWGFREDGAYNAIASANTPVWDHLWETYPHTLISGSGEGVGLPKDQMGNSEVGHLNLGAGRLVYQEFTRIEKAIAENYFFDNQALLKAVNTAKSTNNAVHIFGLLSPGGVHSHENQIFAMIKLAHQQGMKNIYLHAFLDGRDTPPQSALASLQKAEELFKTLGCGKVASIIGRYYAMDRDKRWERTQIAYELLTQGKADYQANNAIAALQDAYAREETDEFVKATTIHNADESPVTIKSGDSIVFMNYRADRARQLTHAFVDVDFKNFERTRHPALADFVSLTHYAKDLKTSIAFPPASLKNSLGEYLANLGFTQLRIAETEKYAHVTFFFNGGIEPPFPGEKRILIPSPKVATYDLKPEMSAHELTDKLVEAITSQEFDLIVCNYANPDMVGHTGNFDATVKAIETIDFCIGRTVDALQKVGGELLITADHGNAELMFDKNTNQPHTAHTKRPVPFIYMGRKAEVISATGILSDVAPTMLHLMNLPIPSEMTGKPLLRVIE